MVMTILEAHVTPENWAALRQAFQDGAGQMPPQLLQSMLVQGASDKSIWRIISIWRSREGLEEMRRTSATPAGVLMFRSAGAEPTLSIFDVASSMAAQL